MDFFFSKINGFLNKNSIIILLRFCIFLKASFFIIILVNCNTGYMYFIFFCEFVSFMFLHKAYTTEKKSTCFKMWNFSITNTSVFLKN